MPLNNCPHCFNAFENERLRAKADALDLILPALAHLAERLGLPAECLEDGLDPICGAVERLVSMRTRLARLVADWRDAFVDGDTSHAAHAIVAECRALFPATEEPR